MKQKFAVFDIDGTIGRTALFFQIVDELIYRGHLPKSARKNLDEKYELYLRRTHPLAYSEYSQYAVDVLFANIKSLKVVDYRAAVDAVIAKSSEYVYTYTRDLAKQLKNDGYFLFALSGSEQYAVEQFTKPLGFDLAVGETYHAENGTLTGEVEEVFRKKDIFLKKYVAEHNLSFDDSYAIGDSLIDAKMLELVEHPIAFNPERQLYELAREKGWKIVVERKNVVYELTKQRNGFLLA